MGCVYKLTNLQNGLLYIGLTTKTLDERWRDHLKNSKHGCEHLISIALREFGEAAFTRDVLVECDDVEQLRELEREFIKKFDTNVSCGGVGYNSTAGGQGTAGFKWSQTSRNKKRISCPVSREQLQCELNTLSWSDVAHKYSVAQTTVRRWAREQSLCKPRTQSVFRNQFVGLWTAEDEETLLSLYLSEKRTIADIANALNRSITSISVKLSRLKKKHQITERRFRNGYQIRPHVKS